MRWWVSKSHPVTDKSLDSAAYLQLHFYSSPSAPRFPLTLYGSSIPFLPLPRPIPYSPPSFTCRRRFYLSLNPPLPTPILPVRGASIHLEGVPIRQTRSPVCISLPCQADQRISLCKPCLPSPVR